MQRTTAPASRQAQGSDIAPSRATGVRAIGRHEIAPAHDPGERAADAVAEHVGGHGRSAGFAHVPVHAQPGARHSSLAHGIGRPPPEALRRRTEHVLGADLGSVRVHQDERAHAMTVVAGARALTHRADVFLGARESPADGSLLSHELAHAAMATDDRVYLRKGTWVERRMWKAFFDHYLPRKFLDHYMDDVGTKLTLSQQEMVDCNATVDIRRSVAFQAEVARLQKAGGGTATIAVAGPGGAMTNGTLGNFTINYKGELKVDKAGAWTFSGTIDYYDFWDFDPKDFDKKSNRPLPAEIKVRVASVALPGKPFHIDSVRATASQSSTDAAATWAGNAPKHVPDKAGRTGADIGVGGVGGDVAAGPVGGDVGGEVGTHSSEDLNK
jgi:hypothetical protein